MVRPAYRPETPRRRLQKFTQTVGAFFGAILLTAAFFLLLPLIKAITKSPQADTTLLQVDAGVLPPPPPPPPEEDQPEEEEQDEPPPPELSEETQPLSLDDLSSALGGGPGAFGGPGLGLDLDSITGGGGGGDDLFSVNQLDQKPRCTQQPLPTLTPKLAKQGPATVYVMFIVTAQGNVQNPMVQKSTNPEFNQAAVSAVKRWKFDPGMKDGEPVSSRMRVPISFPKGN